MSTSVPYPPDQYPSDSLPPQPPVTPAGTAAADDARALDSVVRAGWWLALGGAVTSVVLGVMMIAWPEPGVPCNHCGYCRTHGH